MATRQEARMALAAGKEVINPGGRVLHWREGGSAIILDTATSQRAMGGLDAPDGYTIVEPKPKPKGVVNLEEWPRTPNGDFESPDGVAHHPASILGHPRLLYYETRFPDGLIVRRDTPAPWFRRGFNGGSAFSLPTNWAGSGEWEIVHTTCAVFVKA